MTTATLNYIGSKARLLPFIDATIRDHVGPLHTRSFADLFAGSSVVAQHFKPLVRSIFVNDTEYYSYVLNRHYIGNREPHVPGDMFRVMQDLAPVSGFITTHYSSHGPAGRTYFTPDNAQRIDAIRTTLRHWHVRRMIGDDGYYWLLASLLEAADAVANVASVYGAYLKHIKPAACRPLAFVPAPTLPPHADAHLYQCNANALVRAIRPDVVYLDPPYNARQYGANYHLLNTIACYDTFVPKGKTGLRPYSGSPYCSTIHAPAALDDLIAHTSARWIFLSYNNEGIIPLATIQAIFARYGRYTCVTTTYPRFKADRARVHAADETTEYIHILTKR